MLSGKPYILFCAGEDSGDCLGETLVRQLTEFSRPGKEILAVGAGGTRMQAAGLKPLVDFDTLPVSGFGDVLPKYLSLRKSFDKLKTALESPLCKGLVAIDYPGFNMKLVKISHRLGKPVLYVAPPQVWAWKKKRGRALSQIRNMQLATFFDFEKNVYEKLGCNVKQVIHPFAEKLQHDEECVSQSAAPYLLLLPGSRLGQASRNLPLFLKVAEVFRCDNVKVIAARESLVAPIQNQLNRLFKGNVPSWLAIQLAPPSAEERSRLYREAVAALSAPGTATLELSLSATPLVVCTKVDRLTYAVGKRLVKTKFFALPNIILGKQQYQEFIDCKYDASQVAAIADALKGSAARRSESLTVAESLQKKLSAGFSLNQLMSEFLAQLFEGQA